MLNYYGKELIKAVENWSSKIGFVLNKRLFLGF